MKPKYDAVVEAVENASRWMGGAVVVVDGDDYEAIPQAYLTDGSYTGSRDVVIDLSNGLMASTGYSLDEATAEEVAQLLI